MSLPEETRATPYEKALHREQIADFSHSFTAARGEISSILTSPQPTRVIETPRLAEQVLFHPDGTHFAYSEGGDQMVLRSMTEDAENVRIDLKQSPIGSNMFHGVAIKFNPSGDMIAARQRDKGAIAVWDMSGKLIADFQPTDDRICRDPRIRKPGGARLSYRDFCFIDDDHLSVVADEHASSSPMHNMMGRVFIFSVSERALVEIQDAPESPSPFAVSPAMIPILLKANADGSSLMTPVEEVPPYESFDFSSVNLSRPDAGYGRGVRINYNDSPRKRSQSGRYSVAGKYNWGADSIVVRDNQTSADIREMQIGIPSGHLSHIHLAISDSANGATAFAKDITLWDASQDTSPRVFRAHADRINGLSMNSEGSALLTSSKDKTIKVWQT